ncbi:MAG: alpha/beta hydrolase [Propionibacteriaceae bacterium]|jgi:pimeloyl-ACP methyl ester carboxylesterase|nr:alpha/beta hydrolase [Propionibacteriaceae bacterium]
MTLIPDRSGSVASNDARIAYHVYGDLSAGVPLVLLHGNSESSKRFDEQVAFFRVNRPVVTIDSRGHGDSTLGDVPLSFPTMADDVAAVVEHLGMERFDLFGFSDGGNIALTLACRPFAPLRSLVVVSANLSPEGEKVWVRRVTSAAAWVLRMKANVLPVLRNLSQRLDLMACEPNLTPEDLARIAVPTLVVAGKNDIILPEHTELIHESIAGSQLVIIEDAGHTALTTHAAVFNAAVEAFLKSVAEREG